MATIVFPDECSKCRKKRKNLEMVIGEVPEPQKKGKRIIYGYTPVYFLCKKCLKERKK